MYLLCHLFSGFLAAECFTSWTLTPSVCRRKVSKQELFLQLNQDTKVSDHSLTQRIYTVGMSL